MAFHDLFSSGAVALTTLTRGGTFVVNATAGGTGAPVYAGNHVNHAIVAIGSFGNVGTLWAYAHYNSSGGGTTVLGSIPFGSGDFAAVAFDLTTDTLTALGTVGSGTTYTHISGQITVANSGTAWAQVAVLSYNPRSAGTTPAANGIGALGTRYI